jgi:hypothetical protein
LFCRGIDERQHFALLLPLKQRNLTSLSGHWSVWLKRQLQLGAIREIPTKDWGRDKTKRVLTEKR